MNNTDKGENAADAMEAFFINFGKMDVYAMIVLEEFFKELLANDEK
jgi:hypothetical protein